MASKTKIYIVLEFVTGGKLFDKNASRGRFKEDEARKYFQQLINVVDYCHSRGAYHRDLKDSQNSVVEHREEGSVVPATMNAPTSVVYLRSK
ncbi:hypothetical protein V6N11_034442 [Hibiscus sabdariffa]|uniref:Protein kinase domain-containing protein n=1 Tax=Hibiscus sabdariffa TaxID=183260 RepID=A0ABR2NMK6_9ROSI